MKINVDKRSFTVYDFRDYLKKNIYQNFFFVQKWIIDSDYKSFVLEKRLSFSIHFYIFAKISPSVFIFSDNPNAEESRKNNSARNTFSSSPQYMGL